MELTSPASSQPVWPSELSGWYTEERGLESYTGPDIPAGAITSDAIKLAMLRNAPAVPDGFDAAFLEIEPESINRSGSEQARAGSPMRLLLDPSGDLFVFKPPKTPDKTTSVIDIFDHITNSLVFQMKDLPKTNSFRDTWQVKNRRTGLPIDRLFIPTSVSQNSSLKFRQISVSGYRQDNDSELAIPVEETSILPRALNELFGLVLEVRAKGVEETKNAALIDAVKKTVTEGNE